MKQDRSRDGKLERRRAETYGGEGTITHRRDGEVPQSRWEMRF